MPATARRAPKVPMKDIAIYKHGKMGLHGSMSANATRNSIALRERGRTVYRGGTGNGLASPPRILLAIKLQTDSFVFGLMNTFPTFGWESAPLSTEGAASWASSSGGRCVSIF